jgi:hypothetical protein
LCLFHPIEPVNIFNQLLTHLPISMPHTVDFGIGIPPSSEVFIKLRADITLANNDISGILLVLSVDYADLTDLAMKLVKYKFFVS